MDCMTTTLSNIADVVDDWFVTRASRLEADRAAKDLKSRENELAGEIINRLTKEGITTLGGKRVTVTVTKEEIPVVADWEALYDFIKNTDSFDLLQRRLTGSAVELRWENEEEVPGVTTTARHKLTYTTQGKN